MRCALNVWLPGLSVFDRDAGGDAGQHARLGVRGQRRGHRLESGDRVGLRATHRDPQSDVGEADVGQLAVHRCRGHRRQVQRRPGQARRAKGDDRRDRNPAGGARLS